ncbi:MAG: hypothetical protein HeimC2_39480 [Candidatus Heimdallarchaeota archaeon LC_2]|nr:MAG: hypothetical protein HeimC2_39480 [Candidatus Heimdallarchaeota archaeon LC_2]
MLMPIFDVSTVEILEVIEIGCNKRHKAIIDIRLLTRTINVQLYLKIYDSMFETK